MYARWHEVWVMCMEHGTLGYLLIGHSRKSSYVSIGVGRRTSTLPNRLLRSCVSCIIEVRLNSH